MWHSAVLHLFKCFGQSASRGPLLVSKVFEDSPQALYYFVYFKNLRDKHFLHDENSFSQVRTVVAIHNPGIEPSLELLHRLERMPTIGRTPIHYLTRVLRHTLEWIERNFVKRRENILKNAIRFEEEIRQQGFRL